MAKLTPAFEFHLRELLAAVHASSGSKLERLAVEERTQKFLAEYGAIPTRLNGYQVIGVLPIQHKTPREQPEYAVLVDRPEHAVHRYAVAVWRASFGDSWDCGHYLERLDDALVALVARAKVPTPELEREQIPDGLTRYRIEMPIPSDVDSSALLGIMQATATELAEMASDDDTSERAEQIEALVSVEVIS